MKTITEVKKFTYQAPITGLECTGYEYRCDNGTGFKQYLGCNSPKAGYKVGDRLNESHGWSSPC
jgi:hypothetical protein